MLIGRKLLELKLKNPHAFVSAPDLIQVVRCRSIGNHLASLGYTKKSGGFKQYFSGKKKKGGGKLRKLEK